MLKCEMLLYDALSLSCVKSLGVITDEELTLNDHIIYICNFLSEEY